MVSYLPIRCEQIERIRQATKEDEVMSVLIDTILSGWPETKADGIRERKNGRPA